MALTEATNYDVHVLDTGHLQVRRVDVILRDGVEIARTYHRHVVTPGDDVSAEPDIVQNLATLWTEDQIAAAQAAREAASEI